MQASDVKAIGRVEDGARSSVEIDAGSRDTAARICALMRHVFLYDRGNQLRVLEDTGLTTTQCKALLELGGLGDCPSTWQVSDLAEVFGVSLPAMSRAVDGLVKKELATRVEDPTDRRVRLVRITAAGNDLVDELTTVKRNGLEAFAATLTATQRRKLDAAVESLMDREDIAKTYAHLKEV
jgi:DNA-binding MarR family transcriptional regulator